MEHEDGAARRPGAAGRPACCRSPFGRVAIGIDFASATCGGGRGPSHTILAEAERPANAADPAARDSMRRWRLSRK